MASRSYHQHCSLARALDLIGERWTLLVVRDLLGGPRRYKDLLEGLPGIGTNLLATRLKELSRLGLVEREATEDGRSALYRLSAAGEELEPALVALARFGVAFLDAPEEDDTWRPEWTPLALRARFRPEKARGLEACYAFCVDGVEFHAVVDDGSLRTALGAGPAPLLRLQTSAEAFLALAGGTLTPQQLLERSDTTLKGTRRNLERCLGLFVGAPDAEAGC